MSRLGGRVAALLLSASVLACGAHPARTAVARHGDGLRAARFEDALGDTDPGLVVVLYPRALLEDKVYGPLLRRASERASAEVGVAAVGATALAAFERTDEVVIATDPGARDAVVALVGAPADLDPIRLVDTDGHPLWKMAGELRPGVVELSSASVGPGARESLATLFVLGGRTWVIATGDAVARAREALAHPRDHVRTLLSWADDGTGAPLREGEEIARVDLPGGALRSRDRRLVDGALAPLGRTLERASVSLLPGTEGVIVVHLAYPAAEDAGAAAARAQEVVDAFRRGLIGSADAKDEKPSGAHRLDWLAAAGVRHGDKTVTVRVPLPRPWLETMAKAELDGPPPSQPAQDAHQLKQDPGHPGGRL